MSTADNLREDPYVGQVAPRAGSGNNERRTGPGREKSAHAGVYSNICQMIIVNNGIIIKQHTECYNS